MGPYAGCWGWRGLVRASHRRISLRGVRREALLGARNPSDSEGAVLLGFSGGTYLRSAGYLEVRSDPGLRSGVPLILRF